MLVVCERTVRQDGEGEGEGDEISEGNHCGVHPLVRGVRAKLSVA